jgi:peptidyl-prolyl cis-trans isomerase D
MIRFLQTPTLGKKLVLGGLLLFICVAMVVTLIPGTGVTDFFGSGPNEAGVYATVGNERLLVSEIQRRAQGVARQQGIPQQFISFVVPQVANQMVLQKAMIAEARRLGLTVTDEELRDELRNGGFAPQLYPKGEWIGQQKYDQFTQQIGYSIAEFERTMKDDLLLRKVDSLVQAGATVTDAELQKEFLQQNVRVKFEYAIVTPESLSGRLRPTEAELRKYYQASEPRLKDSIPAERKVKYVLVDAARVLARAKPTPEELQRYYNDHREQFRVEDEVELRHILVRAPEGADQQTLDAARAKAEGLLQQVKSGADFAALAKKSSDDGSAENGGSLGWIRKGQTVPEFEKAAFALQKGQTSGVVKSQFGFHIIKLEDRHAAHLRTLDEVRDQIEPIVAQEKGERLAEQTANNVLAAAKTSGLDAAAAKAGFNVITTDFFSDRATLPGVGSAPEFMSAIFAAKEKSPPQLAKAEQGYAIFQLEAVKPARTPSFEEVRAELETQYKQERAGALLAQRTQELADRAHVLHDLRRAAKELGAEVKTSELVGPSSQVPDIGQMASVEGVFDMKPGQISNPLQAGRNGVVVGLLERQEPPLEQMNAQRETLRESLLRQKRGQAVGVFANSVRERMEKDGKIKYNPVEKERLEKGGLNLGS